MKIDLHNHTRKYSPCSIIEPEKLIEIYCNNNFDGICITEHNVIWSKDEQDDLIGKFEGRIKIFFGAEIDTDMGHVLVFTDRVIDFRGKSAVRIDELVKIFPSEKTAFIWAHPYRWTSFNSNHLSKLQLFDGVELYNGNIGRERIEYTYEKLRKSCSLFTGGSDTHAVQMACKFYTEFEDNIDTNKELIAALKSGRFKAKEFHR